MKIVKKFLNKLSKSSKRIVKAFMNKEFVKIKNQSQFMKQTNKNHDLKCRLQLIFFFKAYLNLELINLDIIHLKFFINRFQLLSSRGGEGSYGSSVESNMVVCSNCSVLTLRWKGEWSQLSRYVNLTLFIISGGGVFTMGLGAVGCGFIIINAENAAAVFRIRHEVDIGNGALEQMLNCVSNSNEGHKGTQQACTKVSNKYK